MVGQKWQLIVTLIYYFLTSDLLWKRNRSLLVEVLIRLFQPIFLFILHIASKETKGFLNVWWKIMYSLYLIVQLIRQFRYTNLEMEKKKVALLPRG